MAELNTHAERATFWQAHIRDWMENHQHQTQAKYCAENGLSKSAFSKWKDRLYPKLRRSKQPNRKAKSWEYNIKQWHKVSKTQADYCNLYAISQSTFSKWKNKLHPELKGCREKKKQKNQYVKFAKISSDQVELLIRGFLADTPVTELSHQANVSLRTCYKYLDRIGWYFAKGATEYPALFNGAGMLLFFGPPPHIHQHLLEKYKGKKKKIGKRKISKIVKEIIIYHSHYDWSVAEAWFFYVHGWWLFYKEIYSKIHGLEGKPLTDRHRKFMQTEYSVGQVVNRLWEHYFVNDMEELLTKETWDAVYYEHSFDSSAKYKQAMFHDLKWIMLNHDPLKRNTYWDSFKPTTQEFNSVRAKIDRYFEKNSDLVD